MLHVDLELNPEIEKQLLQTVNNEFNGSYEKFIENALNSRTSALKKLIDISEELEREDLAENHDAYLYGIKQ